VESAQNFEIVEQGFPEYMLEDSEFVGYPDKDTQEIIYRAAAFGVLPTEGPVNVLDVGCGRGDFGDYLLKTVNPKINYFGIDSAKLNIEVGTKKYSDVLKNSDLNMNLDIQTFDTEIYPENMKSYDWIFHITNLTLDYGYWEQGIKSSQKYVYLEKIIDKTISMSRIGSVFMLLNDYNMTETYIHYNIGSVSDILLERGMKFAIDNSDLNNIFKLIIFNN
jgi:SAM-dependent methyltransferase